VILVPVPSTPPKMAFACACMRLQVLRMLLIHYPPNRRHRIRSYLHELKNATVRGRSLPYIHPAVSAPHQRSSLASVGMIPSINGICRLLPRVYERSASTVLPTELPAWLNWHSFASSVLGQILDIAEFRLQHVACLFTCDLFCRNSCRTTFLSSLSRSLLSSPSRHHRSARLSNEAVVSREHSP
jgi:hypothetical protein